MIVTLFYLDNITAHSLLQRLLACTSIFFPQWSKQFCWCRRWCSWL